MDVKKAIEQGAPLAGQVADLVTTAKGLNAGGREGNPVMGATLDKGGFVSMAVVKVGFGVATGWAVKKLQKGGKRGLARAVSLLGALSGFLPAMHNWKGRK